MIIFKYNKIISTPFILYNRIIGKCMIVSLINNLFGFFYLSMQSGLFYFNCYLLLLFYLHKILIFLTTYDVLH